MPSLQANGKVLVTGVTGYIGAWVAQFLLEKGYSVRGTVRDPSKAKELSDRFSSFGDKFEWVIVKDLQEEGAFNEAVKGVDGILHVASPFTYKSETPEDLIHPAVKGTLSVLKAAHQFGSQVKRIVVTSSFAAIMEPKEGPYTFTEKDWNDFSPKLVEEKGNEAGPFHIYRASKSLAEKSAWNFVKENSPSFDLVTINPVFVFGPFIHHVKDAESINTSVGLVFNSFKGGEINEQTAMNFVDVRDVARAHLNALEVQEAAGNRFILSAGHFGWGQVNAILRRHFPESKTREPKNAGDPGNNGQVASSEQAKKVLGIEFIGLEESIVDTAKDLKRFL